MGQQQGAEGCAMGHRGLHTGELGHRNQVSGEQGHGRLKWTWIIKHDSAGCEILVKLHM